MNVCERVERRGSGELERTCLSSGESIGMVRENVEATENIDRGVQLRAHTHTHTASLLV